MYRSDGAQRCTQPKGLCKVRGGPSNYYNPLPEGKKCQRSQEDTVKKQEHGRRAGKINPRERRMLMKGPSSPVMISEGKTTAGTQSTPQKTSHDIINQLLTARNCYPRYTQNYLTCDCKHLVRSAVSFMVVNILSDQQSYLGCKHRFTKNWLAAVLNINLIYSHSELKV